MKIISIHDGHHDSSISFFENGSLRGSFKEERFSKIKHDENLKKSIDELFDFFNISIEDPELVFCTDSGVPYLKNNGISNEFIFWPWEFGENLIKKFNKKIYTHDHHLSHACSAYFTSGFFNEKTLIVSIDGIGQTTAPKILNKNNIDSHEVIHGEDTVCCRVYGAQNNKLKQLFKIEGFLRDYTMNEYFIGSSNGFLAALYCRITNFLEFKQMSEEGKVLGLSVKGRYNEKFYNFLKKFYGYKDLKYNFDTPSISDWILPHFFNSNKINDDESLRQDIAYNTQLLTEEYCLRFINDLCKKFKGYTKLCLVGGLFANVKLNQKINELTPFEEVWVYPAMGDEGISIGAGYAHMYDRNFDIENKRIDNMFYGIGYTQSFMDQYINNDIHEIKEYNPLDVAKILKNGKIVGTFHGRSEVGPRALGNRSILADPRKRETHEYLNGKLQRNDIMPFAPMIMSEHISDICHAYKSIRTSEFMTMCYTVKDYWVNKIPAAIAPEDNSCRPQTVFKERNLFAHEILTEFNNLTGIPVLINTSFNAHGDPIINHPQHAIEYLNNNIVDYLILGNKLLSKKHTNG